MTAGPSLPVDSLISQRYRIIERVGGGAMAQVYRVEDIMTGEIHALKALRNPPEDDDTEANFAHTARREALFLKTLSHPALPHYEDLFSDEEYVYLLMEFIEGENLKNYLDQDTLRTLDIRTIVHWGVQICDTLAYLHRCDPPVIFRDLKPSNLVRRPDDRICLVDFGIARYASKKNATDTIVLGSPGYAPPEQYGQGQTGPRSDLYALGATLHHLLTGRDPSSAPFKWPTARSLNPITPRPLDNLIMKCVELDAERRPESAEKVGAALREILAMLDEAELNLPAARGASQADVPTSVLLTSDVPPQDATAERTKAKDPSLPLAPEPRAVVEARVPNRVQYAQAHYAAETFASFWKEEGFLRRSLLIGGLCAIFASLCLPMLSGAFEPPTIEYEAPSPLAVSATFAQRQARQQTEDQAMAESAATLQTRANYRALTPLRFLLGVLACGGFLFGGVRSERPGRPHLLLFLGGTFSLFVLSAVTLLPAWSGLFAIFALAETLLALPALRLLLEDRA